MGALLLLVVLGVPGALGLPLWVKRRAVERRHANERAIGGDLKRLACAEAEFRGKDVDGNGIQDFWTGDVAGLYRHGLIDRELALADLHPLEPLGPEPVPKNGYYFMALEVDASVVPPEPYAQVTDAASGKVHHRDRFGFIAVPAEYGVSGRATVVVNEGNSLKAWRHAPWNGERRWPADAERRRSWSGFG